MSANRGTEIQIRTRPVRKKTGDVLTISGKKEIHLAQSVPATTNKDKGPSVGEKDRKKERRQYQLEMKKNDQGKQKPSYHGDTEGDHRMHSGG